MKEAYKVKAIALFLFFLLHFILSPCKAQEKEIQKENQQWLHYYGQWTFSEKWVWLFDGGFRWRENFQERSQSIVRTGVGYLLTPDLRVTAGLGASGYYSDNEYDRLEIRPYQDIMLSQALGVIKSQHRFRVEERFFRKVDAGEIQSGQDFNFRFRYSLMFTVPLVKFPSLNPQAGLLLNFGDEIFINAGKEIVNNVFDQNRILIGPVLQLNKGLSINCLYHSQFRSTSTAGRYRQVNIIWLTVRQSFLTPSK